MIARNRNLVRGGLIGLLLLLMPCPLLAQIEGEEESAEVYLEDYTDEFQDKFFEALKQKGIENYDRAANLLLECKTLDPENKVVDYELAKVYLADKKADAALGYGLNAVNDQPENLWYLDTLVDILNLQGRKIDELKPQLPFQNLQFRENLALVFYRKSNYREALKVLENLGDSGFSKDLNNKIQDSLNQNRELARASTKPDSPAENPLQGLQRNLGQLIESGDFETLDKQAETAIESYPLQPYFYYAKGLAQNRLGDAKKAISVLETGLDFLFDDPDLANKFYVELARAHKAEGNVSKANMYLSKIKDGS